ncbi:MAG: hypothetical protein JEY91_19530, partial [Spirochaetaceae bacterium]|nr:hypothetical protein [Spirochaetaceae bacterium]
SGLLKKIIYPQYFIEPHILELPDQPILRMIELKKRYYLYNNMNESPFGENDVSVIYANQFHYFLGTVRGAVFQYDVSGCDFKELKIPYNSIVNNSITGILQVNDLLVISSFSGIYMYNLNTDEMTEPLDKTLETSIITMCNSGNIVYLGSTDGSLYKWDLHNMVFTKIFHLDKRSISAVNLLNGRLLAGTNRGELFEIRENSGIYSPVNPVNEMTEGSKITFIKFFDKKFWIGASGSGLLLFDRDLSSGEIVNDKSWFLSSSQSKNFIYFGTHGDGILIYDRIGSTWLEWGIRNGLSSLYIPSLYCKDDNLYISTPDEGIVIINEQIHEQKL